MGVHGDPVGRRDGPERRPPGRRSRRARPSRTAEPEGGERRLPHGPEAQDVSAEPGGHGQHRGHHGATRAGEVPAPVDPGGVQAEGLLHRRDPALAHAHAGRPGIGRQAVDVVEHQAGVGHRLQAGVDGQRERIHHQPAAEGRPSHAGEHRTVLEPIGAQGRSGPRAFRLGHGIAGRPPARRREEGEPDVVVVLEPDTHLLPDGHLGGIAADDRGGEPDPGVLGQRHHGERVGRHEGRVPLVVVHRAADDRAPTGDRRRLPGPAPAHRADGHGRVHEGAALRAALDPEATVGPRGPEPGGGRRELRKGPHRAGSRSVPMTCGRSTVVRMPGAAWHTTGTALTARLAVYPGE